MDTYEDTWTVTAAEAAADEVKREVQQGPKFIVLINAQNADQVSKWDFVIHKKGQSTERAMSLVQKGQQRDAAEDVIWEGSRYLPIGWVLTLIASETVTAGDELRIHGGYEVE